MLLNEYMALPRFDAGRYAAIPANHTVQVASVRVSAIPFGNLSLPIPLPLR